MRNVWFSLQKRQGENSLSLRFVPLHLPRVPHEIKSLNPAAASAAAFAAAVAAVVLAVVAAAATAMVPATVIATVPTARRSGCGRRRGFIYDVHFLLSFSG